MNKNTMMTIITRAVTDFGFRQVVLYDFENINNYIQETEKINTDLLETIKTTLISEIEQLPVPVEPKDREQIINTIYEKLDIK